MKIGHTQSASGGFFHITKPSRTIEGCHEFWLQRCRKIITWHSLGLGVRTLGAQGRTYQTPTPAMAAQVWRLLMALSAPAVHVTVCLGKGFIWLHFPFNSRMRSPGKCFCRTRSTQQGLDVLQRSLHPFPDEVEHRQALEESLLSEFSTKSRWLPLPLQCLTFHKGLAPTFL